MIRNLIIFLSVLLFASSGAKAQTVSIVEDAGIPYFHNYSHEDYHGHNRNFDVNCDNTGRVFFANFEGLLLYDGVEWTIYRTPGLSRITQLYRASNGRLWFGGDNVVGYVVDDDSVHVEYLNNDAKKSVNIGVVIMFAEKNEKIFFLNSQNHVYEITAKSTPVLNMSQLSLFKDYSEGVTDSVYVKEQDLTYKSTHTDGIKCFDSTGKYLYNFDETDGLCSKCINGISYDGKGTLWGATDNGVFCMSISDVYTHYTKNDGLIGQVSGIQKIGKRLYVGTYQGLFALDDSFIGTDNPYQFYQIRGVDQAVYQLATTERKSVIAATAGGVFTYDDKLYKKNDNHTVSVIVEDDNHFLTGELSGIYRNDYNNGRQLIDSTLVAIRLIHGEKGGIWAVTRSPKPPYYQSYFLAPGATKFEKRQTEEYTPLLSYVDDNGLLWTSGPNGNGLVCEQFPPELQKWLLPFNELSVQTMFVSDGVAWLGGTFGIVRFDIELCKTTKLYKPQIYFRSENNLVFTYANDKIDPIGTTLYSYSIDGGKTWSEWSKDQKQDFSKYSYGSYELVVRSRDIYNQISTSKTIPFKISPPWYFSLYAMAFYLFLLLYASYLIYRYRLKRIEAENARLEGIVEERTQEVRNALNELRDAQHKLLRQEREATVGKLTKGLIDRILNPMNYINNFSHLTLGLVKDIKGDLEDISDEIGEETVSENDELQDLFEDSYDVVGMMDANLQKIEQHGLSTTRILKTMEELLKDRNGKIEPLDVASICNQNIEMLHNYFAADIEKYKLTVEWQKPEMPIVCDCNAELLSKCIMSMLSNSFYAVKKKADKLAAETRSSDIYKPLVRLVIKPSDGEHSPFIHIYDNGIGIEDSIKDKIFDPFFTTKPTSEASGVGLYLCLQVIQDFGGNIEVQSVKDEYTEFVISMP